MEIRTFKHAAKMSEWQERIQACRSSGQPVSTWCAANGICSKTYYRWERLLIAAATARTEQSNMPQSPALIKVEPTCLAEANEAPCVYTSQVQQSIVIRSGNVSIEFPAETTLEQLALFVRTLNHA